MALSRTALRALYAPRRTPRHVAALGDPYDYHCQPFDGIVNPRCRSLDVRRRVGVPR